MSRRKKFRKVVKQSALRGVRAHHVAFFDRLAGVLLDHEVVQLDPADIPAVACQLTAAYWQGNGATMPSDVWICWTRPDAVPIFQLSAGGGVLPGIGEFGGEPEDLSERTRAAIFSAVDAVARGDFSLCVEWRSDAVGCVH
jgi:hypothetical protein